MVEPDGVLLSRAGDVNSEKIIAALAANIWRAFEAAKNHLNIMVLDCQEGTLITSRLSQFLLCLYH